jgi:hypothetical protein
VEQLPQALLERYAFKATTTWGTLDDYRHFLPHILALTRQGALLCDLEITLRKLSDNDFLSWPAVERTVVTAYLRDWLAESIREETLDRFDSVLCGAAQITDVTPFLEAADGFDHTLTSRYRDGFVRWTARHGYQLTNAFWERGSDNAERVLRWALREDPGA